MAGKGRKLLYCLVFLVSAVLALLAIALTIEPQSSLFQFFQSRIEIVRDVDQQPSRTVGADIQEVIESRGLIEDRIHEVEESKLSLLEEKRKLQAELSRLVCANIVREFLRSGLPILEEMLVSMGDDLTGKKMLAALLELEMFLSTSEELSRQEFDVLLNFRLFLDGVDKSFNSGKEKASSERERAIEHVSQQLDSRQKELPKTILKLRAFHSEWKQISLNPEDLDSLPAALDAYSRWFDSQQEEIVLEIESTFYTSKLTEAETRDHYAKLKEKEADALLQHYETLILELQENRKEVRRNFESYVDWYHLERSRLLTEGAEEELKALDEEHIRRRGTYDEELRRLDESVHTVLLEREDEILKLKSIFENSLSNRLQIIAETREKHIQTLRAEMASLENTHSFFVETANSLMARGLQTKPELVAHISALEYELANPEERLERKINLINYDYEEKVKKLKTERRLTIDTALTLVNDHLEEAIITLTEDLAYAEEEYRQRLQKLDDAIYHLERQLVELERTRRNTEELLFNLRLLEKREVEYLGTELQAQVEVLLEITEEELRRDLPLDF